MAVVHRRAREGVRSVWLSDHTRPFVIVLVEAANQQDHPLGPFGHLGVACASREEIDRLYAEACREGRPTRERGVLEPPAEDGEQEEVLAFDPPRRAHAEITELGRLVGVSQLCTMWSKHSDRSFSR